VIASLFLACHPYSPNNEFFHRLTQQKTAIQEFSPSYYLVYRKPKYMFKTSSNLPQHIWESQKSSTIKDPIGSKDSSIIFLEEPNRRDLLAHVASVIAIVGSIVYFVASLAIGRGYGCRSNCRTRSDCYYLFCCRHTEKVRWFQLQFAGDFPD
jgi:hypothetical protein